MRRIKPATTTNTSVPVPGVTLSTGVRYATPSSVEDLSHTGFDDGGKGLFAPEWGVNAAPEACVIQGQAGQVAGHLVAIASGQRRADLEQQAWAVYARFERVAAEARSSLARRCRSEDALRELRRQAKDADLGEPRPTSSSRRALLICGNIALAVGLAVPDLALTAPAFDRFGLGDVPLIDAIAWSDERHAAAFAVVLACVYLAHRLGRTLPSVARTAGSRLRALPVASPTPAPMSARPSESAGE